MNLIPVTLLTGFLGSGKTTVLNHLVQQPEMAEALVIINEFGEVGLDHLLVSHSRDVVVEMSSGCLCCTIRGDLVKALQDVHAQAADAGRPRFKRVVIETTGLADPAPIVHTLATHEGLTGLYRLDGIIATIDASHGDATLDRHVEAIKQAAMADLLLLTKSDLLDASMLRRLNDRLDAINPAAPRQLVLQGEVAACQVLDLGLFQTDGKIADVRRWLNEERYRDDKHDKHDTHIHREHPPHAHGQRHHGAHAGHGHDVNRHDDRIRAFCFTVDEPIPVSLLTNWLDAILALMGKDMLRIKGILNLAGEPRPMVIHGVQHILHPPLQLDAWPSEDRRSKIVFITHGIERRVIDNTFSMFRKTALAT